MTPHYTKSDVLNELKTHMVNKGLVPESHSMITYPLPLVRELFQIEVDCTKCKFYSECSSLKNQGKVSSCRDYISKLLAREDRHAY